MSVAQTLERRWKMLPRKRPKPKGVPLSRREDYATYLMGQLPRVSDDLADGADAFLEHYPKQKADAQLLRDDPTSWALQEVQNLKVASREQQDTQLAFAYSLYVKAARDDDYRRAIVRLAMDKRKKPDRRTHIVNLIVELVVTYGDGTEESRKKNRGLYNRDAHAIRYLIAQGIGPHEVVALADQPGEGRDSWSRQCRFAEQAAGQGEARKSHPERERIRVIVDGTESFSVSLEKTEDPRSFQAFLDFLRPALDLLEEHKIGTLKRRAGR